MDQSKHQSNYVLLLSLFAQCPLPRNTPSPPIQKEQHTTETFCCSSRTSVRTPHRSCWTRSVSDLLTLSPLCKLGLLIWSREKARCQNVSYQNIVEASLSKLIQDIMSLIQSIILLHVHPFTTHRGLWKCFCLFTNLSWHIAGLITIAKF